MISHHIGNAILDRKIVVQLFSLHLHKNRYAARGGSYKRTLHNVTIHSVTLDVYMTVQTTCYEYLK